MLTHDVLCREAQVTEMAVAKLVRYALWLSPFAVKAAFGFEWAVLVGILVGTRELREVVRAVVFDTSCINLMKQYEHKLQGP